MPAIKICGICNLEDAQKSVSLGADYLGFIFAESKRAVDPSEARLIRRKLKGQVKFVGVFKDQDPRFVNDAAEVVGLDLVQLHGSELPEYCRQINHPVIKAIEIFGNWQSMPGSRESKQFESSQDELSQDDLIQNGPRLPELTRLNPQLLDYTVHAILFDRPKAESADHEWLNKIIEQFGQQMQRFQPFFIAGGLNAENVGLACSLNPFGIDVASGVESKPGVKDHKKLEAFFQAIQGAKLC